MDAYQFEHPEYLYWLALIPAFLIVFWFTRVRAKAALRRFGELPLLTGLMPDFSPQRKHFKFYSLMVAILFLVIAASGFKVGTKIEEMKKEGVELVIALDISNSMLAEDIQPNRMERSKQAISKLVDELSNDKFGLVVFAGDAFVQLPVTTDYAAAKMVLSTVDPKIAPNQGTAIGAAIKLAQQSFSTGEGKNRAIIIISDGENHEDDALLAVREANEKGIIVHTIGMGLSKGAPIPQRNGLKGSYRTNAEGEVVVSKLNESMLMQIAAEGGGTYIRASNTNTGLSELFKQIHKMDKTEFETKGFVEFEDQFQYFVAFALLFLLVEFILLDRKNKYLKRIKLFNSKEAIG